MSSIQSTSIAVGSPLRSALAWQSCPGIDPAERKVIGYCTSRRDECQTVQLATSHSAKVKAFFARIHQQWYTSALFAHLEAVVDGVCVYVAGSKGIMGVNPRTSTALFRAPWPRPATFDGRPFSEAQWRLHGALSGDSLVLPPAFCVDEGALYVRVSATRVAALETTESAHGE